jgi:adenylyl-sulfate kinase
MAGFTLWFTGLSGSGKSTLAHAVTTRLQASGRLVDLLDGDVVRQHLSKGLGFSKEDRNLNLRRIGFVRHLITKHGGIAVTAAISPYRAIRKENRKLIGSYVEVYCHCPLEVCEQRDVKGLYKKARKALEDGQGLGFTGIDDPYEEPEAPEITVDTANDTIEAGVERILGYLQSHGFLDAESAGADARVNHGAEAEYLPPELLEQAVRAFEAAGQVHAGVLMEQLHLGRQAALHVLDRLGRDGRLGLRP